MAEIDDLFDEMERSMHHVFHERVLQHVNCGYWRPSLDIYELPEKIVVLVELPGVDKDDAQVTFADGILTVEGTRPDPSPGEDVRRHQLEIDHGHFKRRIKLGLPVKDELIEANLKDGYLRIEIPKG